MKCWQLRQWCKIVQVLVSFFQSNRPCLPCKVTSPSPRNDHRLQDKSVAPEVRQVRQLLDIAGSRLNPWSLTLKLLKKWWFGSRLLSFWDGNSTVTFQGRVEVVKLWCVKLLLSKTLSSPHVLTHTPEELHVQLVTNYYRKPLTCSRILEEIQLKYWVFFPSCYIPLNEGCRRHQYTPNQTHQPFAFRESGASLGWLVR